jgi:tryptophan 2,3-dioxygenase
MADYGDSKLTYNEYLKVPELLKLQECLSQPPSHDELQFIIVHQAYELWFKLMLFEIDTVIELMGQQNVRAATWLINRVIDISKLLYQQIHILETMSPRDFLQFRDNLKPASGFQSIQFRELEFVSNLKDLKILEHIRCEPEALKRLQSRFDKPTLWDAFLDLMNRQGFSIPADKNTDAIKKELVRLHEQRDGHYDLYLLSEALIEYDEFFGLWRLHHIRMVERMIGNKIGTGGSEGVRYLATTLNKKCFPELWDMRTLLIQDSSPPQQDPSRG